MLTEQPIRMPATLGLATGIAPRLDSSCHWRGEPGTTSGPVRNPPTARCDMFRYELDQGTCIADPGAALTLDSPHQFKSFVVELLENEPIELLIVTFERVNRIDSFGIGVIVGLFKATQQQNKRFAVTNMSESHRKLFAMTGVDKVIEIFDTNSDAVESVRE